MLSTVHVNVCTDFELKTSRQSADRNRQPCWRVSLELKTEAPGFVIPQVGTCRGWWCGVASWSPWGGTPSSWSWPWSSWSCAPEGRDWGTSCHRVHVWHRQGTGSTEWNRPHWLNFLFGGGGIHPPPSLLLPPHAHNGRDRCCVIIGIYYLRTSPSAVKGLILQRLFWVWGLDYCS